MIRHRAALRVEQHARRAEESLDVLRAELVGREQPNATALADLVFHAERRDDFAKARHTVRLIAARALVEEHELDRDLPSAKHPLQRQRFAHERALRGSFTRTTISGSSPEIP